MARAQKLDIVRTLRITPDLDNSAKAAGKRLGTTDKIAFRLAAEIGFEVLRIIDFDVPNAVVHEAIRRLADQKLEK